MPISCPHCAAQMPDTAAFCPGCGRAFEELDPRLFSFNSPHGACEECGGFGEIWKAGGKVVDTGRAAADDLRLPFVCVPTIAASDAPPTKIGMPSL